MIEKISQKGWTVISSSISKALVWIIVSIQFFECVDSSVVKTHFNPFCVGILDTVLQEQVMGLDLDMKTTSLKPCQFLRVLSLKLTQLWKI